jgi:Flp pilus assembly protein TadG
MHWHLAARPGARRRGGQVMVEVAVAFPLLVMAALALVQFGLYYHAHNVVETAVQEGARMAAADQASYATANQHANNVLHAGLGRRSDVHITVEPDTSETVRGVARGSMATFIPWFDFRSGPTNLKLPLNATAIVSREHFRGRP